MGLLHFNTRNKTTVIARPDDTLLSEVNRAARKIVLFTQPSYDECNGWGTVRGIQEMEVSPYHGMQRIPAVYLIGTQTESTLQNMNVFSQEFLAGTVMVILASSSLKLQQQEWYWKKFYSGYWKAHNTPDGRMLARLKCWAIMALGIACCLGLIPFTR